MRRFDGYRYRVEETKDGRVHFLFNEGYPDEKEFTIDDHAVFDSLQQIVQKHKMYKYSGNYKPLMKIHDGHSWNLSVRFASGKSISAHGYMAGPRGYKEAFKAIIQCLDQWKSYPAPVNEVVYFDYVYGAIRYHVERQDDHAVMTIDDNGTGEHQSLERSLNMLEDVRMLVNMESLKENRSMHSDDPEAVNWSYEVSYANGEKYRCESYDAGYKCGTTHSLQRFVFDWIEGEVDIKNRYY